MEQTKPTKRKNGRETAKNVVLSFQHMFAMLGATILVPILARHEHFDCAACGGYRNHYFLLSHQKEGAGFSRLKLCISARTVHDSRQKKT